MPQELRPGVIPHPLPEVFFGFLFSRFINVMCQVHVSIFWHCWFTRRRFLNIKIINHFHHFSSVVCRPSVNISHFNLLLRNHGANCNQTLVEWSLDGPLPSFIKICLICIIGIYRLKEKFHKKTQNIC
jgi:hypothetical protein